MKSIAALILGLCLLAGCSSSEPAQAEPEGLDPLPVLQDAVDGLKRKVDALVRKGKLEDGEAMAFGELKLQPDRGVRWKRPERPLEEHLLEDLKGAGFTISAETALRINALVTLKGKRSADIRQTTCTVFLEVFRGRQLLCSQRTSVKTNYRFPAE